jgi:hypothetical protein
MKRPEDVDEDVLVEKVRLLTEEKHRLTVNFEVFQEEIDLQLQQLEGDARALAASKQRAHARVQRRVIEINQQLKKFQDSEEPSRQGNGNS